MYVIHCIGASRPRGRWYTHYEWGVWGFRDAALPPAEPYALIVGPCSRRNAKGTFRDLGTCTHP